MTWEDCVHAMSDQHCNGFAKWRGYDPTFCKWLRDSGHVGIHNGFFAFPIASPSEDGRIVGCHVRGNPEWYVNWFVDDPKLHRVTALVLGEPTSAEWGYAFESQFDAFAVLCGYKADQRADFFDQGCFIVTRGAQNSRLIRDLFPSTCQVSAWPQNDPPKGKKPPPSERWIEGIAKYAGCIVRRVQTPESYKDANDWFAVDRGQGFAEAVEAATEVVPLAKAASSGPPDWGALGLVDTSETERTPFPKHLLPEVAANFIGSIAEVYRIPESVAGPILLATISAAMGAGLTARLLAAHTTRANLYVFVSASSAFGKSTTFGPILAPLLEAEAELLEDWKLNKFPQASARKLSLTARIERLRADCKKADAQTQSVLQTEIASILRQLDELDEQSAEPRLRIDDITTEKAAVVMQQNKETAALISSDAGDVISNIVGRYRKNDSSDDNFYVKAYSGDPIHVSRVNRPSVHLRAPCLTMLLLVQPFRLAQLLSNPTLMHGGLMPRFLIASVSDPPSHLTAEIREMPVKVKQRYTQLIRQLVHEFRLRKDPAIAPVAPVARVIITDYYNAVIDRVGTTLRDVESFAMRWAEQACRLSIVLHAGQHGAKAAEIEISPETATAAVQLAQWFEAEQLNVLASHRGMSTEQRFTAIWRFAQQHSEGFTSRELQRGLHLPDAETAKRLLTQMVELGMLTVKTDGKKTVYQGAEA